MTLPGPGGQALPAPFLRSPPFPGTAADVAAVSHTVKIATRRESLSSADRDRARSLIDRIARYRIGGSFWGIRPDGSAATEVDPWHGERKSARFNGDDERGFVAWLAGRTIEWITPGLFADHSDGGEDSLERAVIALLIDAVEYRDPYSGRPVSVETTVEQLGFWRSSIDRNRGLTVATGIARWKQREVEAMLWPGTAGLRFARSAQSAVDAARLSKGEIAVWPTRAPPGLDMLAGASAIPVHPVEDGFMRSSGLGSDCHPPHSIILDRRGLHFDPRQPSDLERMIATPVEDPALLARAERLMRTIVESGISKYAIGKRPFDRPATSRKVVLVAGQVEDDLSVQLGAAGVSGNLDLIVRVRRAEPDAFLIFRPHPDVDAGHRKGRVEDRDALRHVDLVVRDASIASMLEAIDSVHVLTSLTGFEALMRDCEVVTHGYPFYAGWGLTHDLAPPIERRGGRIVSKAELVAAALISYPRYVDPVTKLPCPPEILVERLAAQPIPQETLLTRLRRLQGMARRGLARTGLHI